MDDRFMPLIAQCYLMHCEVNLRQCEKRGQAVKQL